MILFCIRRLHPCQWIYVNGTELLSTVPAPGSSTACAHIEDVICLKAARKNIVACCIFEGPALAPRALLCIRIGRHLLFYRERKETLSNIR